jgi:protein disulfide-isomerase
MRLPWLALFLSAATLGITQAVDSDTIDDAESQSTYFNGKEVPPLLELTGDNIDDKVKASKFFVVKYYQYELLPYILRNISSI